MNKSDSIEKLAEALSKAQGAMKNAAKESANPYFKSKYADLASVWDACRKELSDNGLAVVQVPAMKDGKVVVTTILLHSSGQWIDGELELTPVKDDPQGAGSAITYARRYALSGFAGIAPEDDDGNAASGKSAPENGKTSRSFRNESGAGNSPNAATTVKGTVTANAPDSDVVCIEQGQATNMRISFRTALPKPIQKDSDKLMDEWLTKKGFVDADGKASALKIPKDLFYEFRNEAEQYAKSFHEHASTR